MAAVVRKKAMSKAPAVGTADMLRIAPQSPFSCRGPYIVTSKDDNTPFAQIRLVSNISNDISVSWEVDVTSAGDSPKPLTKSTHQENAATKEWEVAVKDGNGTTMFEYAYKRFNPALGAQRMNVTDSNGVIVAFIEYQFLHDDYDVMLLLELAALVSHDEAPWCLAVTSAYVVIIACCVLLIGIGVAWMLSKPATRRRGKSKRRRHAESQADKSRRALEEALHGKSS